MSKDWAEWTCVVCLFKEQKGVWGRHTVDDMVKRQLERSGQLHQLVSAHGLSKHLFHSCCGAGTGDSVMDMTGRGPCHVRWTFSEECQAHWLPEPSIDSWVPP